MLLVPKAEKADFDAILATGKWPEGFDPRRTVLLDSAAPPAPSLATPTGGQQGQAQPGTVRIADYGTTEVTLKIDAPQGGYVVLNDVWHRWWQVEIDDEPAELLRANVLFRAVQVPPGRSTVRFVFRPLRGLFEDVGKRLRGQMARSAASR